VIAAVLDERPAVVLRALFEHLEDSDHRRAFVKSGCLGNSVSGGIGNANELY